MKTMRKPLISIFLIVPFITLGCAVEKRIEPVKITPFLGEVGLVKSSKLEHLPFGQSWVAADFDSDKYLNIVISPVTTDYINLDDWRDSLSVAINSKEDYKKEIDQLAKFATEQLHLAFVNDKENRFKVAGEIKPATLILEMSLSEIIFAKPLASAGALVAPVPGAGVAASAITDPYVGFEVKLRDAFNQRIMAAVADRSFSTARIVNFNKLTASSANRDIIQAWVKLAVRSLNGGKMKKISKKAFEIIPW